MVHSLFPITSLSGENEVLWSLKWCLNQGTMPCESPPVALIMISALYIYTSHWINNLSLNCSIMVWKTRLSLRDILMPHIVPFKSNTLICSSRWQTDATTNSQTRSSHILTPSDLVWSPQTPEKNIWFLLDVSLTSPASLFTLSVCRNVLEMWYIGS